MSLLGEVQRQIGLASPGLRILEILDKKVTQVQFDEKMKLSKEVYEVLTGIGTALTAVGTPLEEFNYPPKRRRIQATTQSM